MKRYAFVVLLLLVCLPLAHAAEKKTSPPSPPPPASTAETSISGKATIELRTDLIQNLTGLELILIPETGAPGIRKIREERWRELASRFRFNDGYNNLDLQAIGAAAVKQEIARATVDEKGDYQFKGVKPGSYRIYGQYKSNYAAAYWLVPVVVKKNGETVTLPINNSNLAEVYNYQKQ